MDNNISVMKSARYGFKKFEDFVWNKQHCRMPLNMDSIHRVCNVCDNNKIMKYI